nr:DUF4097 family beta strand repeat protein [candidate division Zixibacteria bacterium]
MFRIIVYILISFISGAVSVRGTAFKFEYEKSFELPQKAELLIINLNGRIEVRGVTEKTITIRAIKNVRAVDQTEAERVAEHIEIKAEKQGRRILINTRYHDLADGAESFWNRLFKSDDDAFGSVDFTILVPEECALEMKSPSGAIRVADLVGDIHVIGGSGPVEISNIRGNLSINATSGEIDISGIEGNVDVDVSSSNINFGYVEGAVELQTTSGDKVGTDIKGSLKIIGTSGKTRLSKINGDIGIKSTSGEVNAEQEYGSFHIETGSGNITVKTELLSENEYFFETGSGRVNLLVPEFASGSVNMETESGEIKVDLPLTIRNQSEKKLIGNFGMSGPKITILTATGDIRLAQY